MLFSLCKIIKWYKLLLKRGNCMSFSFIKSKKKFLSLGNFPYGEKKGKFSHILD